ncbi:MAG: CBS domain-containing protein [Myxococcota bacterium]
MRRSERVSKWMTTEVRSVQVGQKLSEVNALMQEHGFHHVPVVEGSKLVGILSSTDLLRVSYEYGIDQRQTNAVLDDTITVAQLMSEPTTVDESATLREALELLAEGQFHAVPVVDQGTQLVGILTTTDVVRHLLEEIS